MADYILKEDGDRLLEEDGDKLLLTPLVRIVQFMRPWTRLARRVKLFPQYPRRR